MSTLKSNVQINSQKSQENKKKWLKIIEKLNGNYKKSKFEGSSKQIIRARERKKLLARERIELILDIDSPFIELMPLCFTLKINHLVSSGNESIIAVFGLVPVAMSNNVVSVVVNMLAGREANFF